MKNLFLLLVLVTTTSLTAFASTDPVAEKVSILENSAITVTVAPADADLFTTAEFDGNNLEFATTDEISFIQIFNANGELEFQLPVMSNQVTIGKSLVEKGAYKLGFMIEGSTDIHFTDVNVK